MKELTIASGNIEELKRRREAIKAHSDNKDTSYFRAKLEHASYEILCYMDLIDEYRKHDLDESIDPDDPDFDFGTTVKDKIAALEEDIENLRIYRGKLEAVISVLETGDF